jgi:antitoxin ParD1/3/4
MIMTTVRKTIIVTEKQDSFIKAQVELGDYTNDSEYIRDLIRRDQESKMNLLRAALHEGEQSGEARRVDPAEFKKRMAERVARAANA